MTNLHLRDLSLPQDEEPLYQILSDFVGSLTAPCEDVAELALNLLEKAESEVQRQIVTLYVLELWMYFPADGPNRGKVEDLIRSLSHLSPTSLGSDDQHSLASIKYHDLVTDYQYLFASGAKELKLVELMTKKLTVFSSATRQSCVIRNIYTKVSIYYMLCGSDHRKGVIFRYLQEKDIFSRLPKELCGYIDEFLRDRLVPYQIFNQFVETLQGEHQFSLVLKRHMTALVKNFMDCNMSKLPRFYLCISFDRIQQLLVNGESALDIQDFIYEMVIAHKLPSGTKVDQVQRLVWFGGEPAKYDELNTRVKYICDIVNSL